MPYRTRRPMNAARRRSPAAMARACRTGIGASIARKRFAIGLLNPRASPVIRGHRRFAHPLETSRFAGLSRTVRKLSRCLPCRRSWVRVPSAASANSVPLLDIRALFGDQVTRRRGIFSPRDLFMTKTPRPASTEKASSGVHPSRRSSCFSGRRPTPTGVLGYICAPTPVSWVTFTPWSRSRSTLVDPLLARLVTRRPWWR
jgi:hypothetical protein